MKIGKKHNPIRIIIITDSIVMLATAMLGPIYALFVEEIGGTLLEASLTGAVFAVSAGLTCLLGGKISDKIRERKYVVIIGYAIICLGFLLMTQVKTINFLLLVQVIIGIGQAFYLPAFDSLFSKYSNKRHQGVQWGIWESMFYFTTAVGALIGGLIVTQVSFQAMFFLMALLCFISAFYIFLVPKKVL
ncbi:MFS transporter [Patescibacteria group bacterium]|nr:MFS transporter [Patescibacteria group bacterium]